MGARRSRGRRGPTRGKPRILARGIIEMNPQGYGFVKTAQGEYFIPKRKTGGAFHGDTVEIAETKREASRGHRERREEQRRGKKQEARVVNVVERAHGSIIGRYEVAEPFGIVVPLDPRIGHDIFTQRCAAPDIPAGSIVRVTITEYPTRNTAACGVVEEIIGNADDPDLLIEQIIARHKLKDTFTSAALAEADACSVDVVGALAEGYEDIRERFVFTIDPADARDFDDALSVEEVVSGPGVPGKAVWRLGVHIADVSRYVEEGSALDLEARERTCSVYLPDRVLPMLPEKLSNEVCSLKPGEDRLCMTVDIFLDAELEPVGVDIYPAIMRSRVRLDYDRALDILEGCGSVAGIGVGELEEIRLRLHMAHRIAQARQRHRERDGGLEFRTKEAKVRLDEAGEPLAIEVRQKTCSTELIEEAMIFANEAVALYLEERGYPCPFRSHEPPAADSIAALLPVLQESKWFTREMARKLAVADPYAIQEVLTAVEGRREETLVSTLLLRCMARAHYSLENLGHYGLGLDSYCHFTSPIRRYPDLLVHRLLKLAFARDQRSAAQKKDMLCTACERCSEGERVAEAASTDATRALMCLYMEQFVGTAFSATISGVASYGLYVQLENCAERLLPVRGLGDEHFAFDPVRLTLTGSSSGEVYRLGDAISVRLVEADSQLSRLTFSLSARS